MEKPLIVLVDPEAQTVSLFGAVNRTLPLHETTLLRAYIGGRDVMYVSAAQEASGEEVSSYVDAIVESMGDVVPGEPLYVRSLAEGYKRIPDIKLTFNGPKDAKPLEKLGRDVFDRSPMLRKMLLNDEVEILTESEARSLRKPSVNLQAAKDKQLDGMLIDNHEAAEDIDNIFTEENDIDSDENTEVMTEAEEMIRKRGFGKRIQ